MARANRQVLTVVCRMHRRADARVQGGRGVMRACVKGNPSCLEGNPSCLKGNPWCLKGNPCVLEWTQRHAAVSPDSRATKPQPEPCSCSLHVAFSSGLAPRRKCRRPAPDLGHPARSFSSSAECGQVRCGPKPIRCSMSDVCRLFASLFPSVVRPIHQVRIRKCLRFTQADSYA